jgi:hypothetical protein
LFVPWLANLADGYLMTILGDKLTTPPGSLDASVWEYNQIGSLDTFLAPVWWLAMPLGLGLDLWHRRRGAPLVGLWWFLLVVAANPAWFSLPGTGIISNFALSIAVYIPAALLSAVLVVHLLKSMAGARWQNGLAALLLVVVALCGSLDRSRELDLVSHALVTRPDVRAAAWIQKSLPTSSRFFANCFFAYSGNILVGSDGGWWLPLLALRQTSLPPITYNSELLPTSDYRQRIHTMAQQMHELGPADPTVLDLLDGEKVTHVYIGQRQGRVNYGGPKVLDPQAFLSSEAWKLVYHQDRVWIFERTR